MKPSFVGLCSLIFFANQAFGQTPGLFVPKENREGNEYFVGKHEGKPLIKVQLLSGVHSPGIYHVPVQTSLVESLAYAGGADDDSDLESVTVRSDHGDGFDIHTYNLKNLMATAAALPTAHEGDIITLPNSQVKLNKVQVWVTIASSVITAILAGTLIHQNQK